jgi:hypothetical protein
MQLNDCDQGRHVCSNLLKDKKLWRNRGRKARKQLWAVKQAFSAAKRWKLKARDCVRVGDDRAPAGGIKSRGPPIRSAPDRRRGRQMVGDGKWSQRILIGLILQLHMNAVASRR